MRRETAEFIIYIINKISNKTGLYPSRIYSEMEKTGCITGYLVPFFDVLHTMSSESAAEDVLAYVRLRGSEI